MKIIDCHVHPQAIENYTDGIAHLLRHMRRHGIERMIASDLGDGWQAYPDAQTLRIANDRLKKACLENPQELYYLVYLNPQLPDWQAEFARHRTTACGVKLWISLWSQEYGLSRSVEVLQAAAAAGLPVLIHTFELTDGVRPGAVGIDGIIELARAVPECRIVAAHACGNWRKAVKRVAEFPENIVFDVSGGYPERGMVERLAAAFGSDRLLYGSDAYGRSFGSQLFKVLGSKLSEGDLRKILYTNAMRVFRLPGINVESKISLSAWQIPGGNEDHFCFVGKSSYFDHAVDCRNLVEAAAHCGVDTLFAADLSVLESVDRVAANEEFKIEAKDFPAIKPLAAVNLINRQDCLRQLENMEGFAGIWISPYCDNYKLDYDSFREFFDLCAQRKIFVWINTALSDYRFRCKKLHSRVVSTAEIAEFIRQAPENYYTFQGVNMPLVMHQTMPEYCRWECSRLSDGEYSAEHLLRDKMGDVHNLCWGSEYPFREYDAVKSVLSGKL